MPLSDTQAILLAAAANRDDRLIPISNRLKGGAAENVARQLLKHRLAEAIEVAANAPFWRRRDDGVLIGLRITETGLAAIGLAAEDSGEEGRAGKEIETGRDADADSAPEATFAKPASAPREGSKLALVVSLLGRPYGASIGELVAATNWQPHTVRAALTRLRQGGLAIERRSEADGARYVIVADPDTSDQHRDEDAAGDPSDVEGARRSNSEGPDRADSVNARRTEDADRTESGA